MPEQNDSYHIFLLPFSWGKKGPKNKRLHFSDLVSLDDAHQVILQDQRWEHVPYTSFQSPEDYNEYVYFYPSVRDVLYDGHEEVENTGIIRHYQFIPALDKKLKYVIEIETDNLAKTYELNIEAILLNIYPTGIGVLSYHLQNIHPQQQDWTDILTINDFGRRLYPSYFDYSGNKGFSVKVPQNTSLAKSIRITSSGIDSFSNIIEDFETESGLTKDYASTVPSQLHQIPNHVKKVLPESFYEECNIRPTLDDRMFVVSSISDNESKYYEKVKTVGSLETLDDFHRMCYQYIFIDGPDGAGLANDKYQKTLLEEHLYTRWQGFGTIYGLTRYSLVSYSTWDKIQVDTRTIYYKIAELCLLQRCSVIKFSEEVRRIALMNENENRFSAYINDLYKNYIIFINKIYFRDITPQEQGIELYDMLRNKMRIEKEVTDLDREINELHQYALLQEERSSNSRLQLLTVLGGFFVVPSFIMSYFGMENTVIKNQSVPLALLLVAIISLIASLKAVQQRHQASRSKYWLGISYKTWVFIGAVIAAIFLVMVIIQQMIN